jgi:hypothetical protein
MKVVTEKAPTTHQPWKSCRSRMPS